MRHQPQCHFARAVILSAASALALCPWTFAQASAQAAAQTTPPPQRLTFDVAAIHPTKPGTVGGAINALPGGLGYAAHNIPVKLMISLMYKIPMRQIQGGPEWMDRETFDVEAKADRAYNLDDLHTMYQNLLADRFNLKFHIDTREGNIYALTVDPGGLKMKRSEAPQDFKIPVSGGPQHLVGTRVPISYLCWLFGQGLQSDERPVVNMTGLNGNYDFVLSFRPELPLGAASDSLPPELQELPPIFIAVREQLGLRLQPQKGPVQYFVIDHIDKPSEN